MRAKKKEYLQDLWYMLEASVSRQGSERYEADPHYRAVTAVLRKTFASCDAPLLAVYNSSKPSGGYDLHLNLSLTRSVNGVARTVSREHVLYLRYFWFSPFFVLQIKIYILEMNHHHSNTCLLVSWWVSCLSLLYVTALSKVVPYYLLR